MSQFTRVLLELRLGIEEKGFYLIAFCEESKLAAQGAAVWTGNGTHLNGRVVSDQATLGGSR